MPPRLVAGLAGAALLVLRRPRRAAAAITPHITFLMIATARARSKLQTIGEQLRLPAPFAAMRLGWGIGIWRGIATQLFVRGDVPPNREAGS